MTGTYTMQEVFNMTDTYNEIARQIGQRTRVYVEFGEDYGAITDYHYFTSWEMFKEWVRDTYVNEYGRNLLKEQFTIGETTEIVYKFGKDEVRDLFFLNLVERDAY